MLTAQGLSITSQPQSQTVLAGSNVIFTVGVTGNGAFSYQWIFNGVALDDETNSSFVIINAQLGHQGSYQVAVSNQTESVLSTQAILTVHAPPAMANSIPDQTKTAGEDAIFVAPASGTPPLSYQWWKNGLRVPEETHRILILTNVQPKDSGEYFVVATNAYGSATSSISQLTVVLILSVDIEGSGSVSLTPRKSSYAFGETVSLTAVPDEGYGFVNWAGDAVGKANPLLLTMDGHKHVIATFRTHTLTVSSIGNGTVRVEPNRQNFVPFSTVTLTAIPAPGNAFLSWSGDTNGDINPLSIMMDQSKTITATFLTLVLNLATQGSGSISKAPEKPLYSLGDRLTLTATPRLGFAFERWDDGVLNNPRTITIGFLNNYTAFFSPTTAVETLSFGSVSRTAPVGTPALFVDGVFVPTGSVLRTSTANITMQTTFQRGTIFYSLDASVPSFESRWYTGPIALQRTATIRALAYDANFLQSWEADPIQIIILPTYSMSATTAGGGSVLISPGTGSYVSNSTITVIATPAQGWNFLQWLGDGNGEGTTNRIVMDRSKCAQAVFGTALSTITSGGGSVLVGPSAGLFPYNSQASLTAVPQPGKYFAFWGNAATGTNNPLRFRITNATPVVSCLFGTLAAGQFALTVIPNGNGQVTISPRANRYNDGQSVTLTASPEPDQSFLGWDGDATGTQNPLLISINRGKIISANFTRRPKLSVWKCGAQASREDFQLLLTGELVGNFQMDQSTDLIHWSPLAFLTNLYGVLQLNDPFTTNWNHRFYRALAAP